MTGFLDAATRVLILVLSALATLAIIGSIAAIPSGEVAQQLGMETERTAPLTEPEPTSLPDETAGDETASAGSGTLVEAAAAPELPKPERWLEVIAYALIGIAGLLAVIALTLMRAVFYLRESSRS